ncbi:hypothetical protein SeMB42_g04743 [Synchytrium endobioticum]|uniref:Protein disulfide-isomerase n=1 Tax=Synchytrium endobioticum TaxID=286115 RepID=A0A507CW33_9FUNG|nr:hypothetical protein SeLEV6574_g05211 [Synchytrium endobioticum]TPX43374.1 hypothetical protein SeMB42_g04743 [Synchytrium endobioticum]
MLTRRIVLWSVVCISYLSLGGLASDVHDLTAESFEKFLDDFDLALVEFYAHSFQLEGNNAERFYSREHEMELLVKSRLVLVTLSAMMADTAVTLTNLSHHVTDNATAWCGHCKALVPEYETAATELKASDIALGKVDCTVEARLCEDYEVRGYPTLKVFKRKQPIEYSGQRKADSMVSFMKKMKRPVVTTLTADEVPAFSKEDKVVIIAFMADNTTSDYAAFKNVASKLSEKFSFGFTDDPAAKEAHANGSAVVLFKRFDEGRDQYPKDKPLTESDLESFIAAYSVPLIDEIGPENYAAYVESGKPLAYVFVATEEQRAALRPAMETVAKEFKADVNFVYIDAVKFGGHAKNLNLKEEWPAFAIHKPAEGAKYPFDGSKQITEDSIREFVTDFVKGNITASVKSETAPEPNDEPVKVVVGSTYEKIVLDESKDVLLELYAPWCGHCKKLVPIWEELAAKIKGVTSDIVIAKMDATENDLPPSAGYQVQGFPTIKLVTANTNQVLEYSGDRSVDALIQFLETNAVNKASLTEKTASGVGGGDVTEQGASSEGEALPERDEL